MHRAVDLEQQLAAEDVQRLLERMEVATEPAAGLEGADRDLGVDGALLGADDDRPGEAVRGGRRRERRRDAIPVNPSDETGQRCAPRKAYDRRRDQASVPTASRRMTPSVTCW